MFTAARMIAALCLAGLAWLGSDYVMGLMPEREHFGMFPYINTLIGFLCGWIIVGPRAGRGTAAAISHGFTGVVAALIWVLLLHSTVEMVDLAMKHRYGGALDAFAAIFEIAVEYGALLLNTGFIMLMVIGAVVTGFLPEIASRHWR
ncbi:TrgA family protein [Citreicella sp. C3M06]|uniref:TrgA family protein n=1 Tax=Citreicella sp. C3M06 TaxID=2841564 RepID=UPI001C09BD3A|nr:TrgA family protein [Citreicella sp. C3M06]MBU2962138.1 TrgA family protein [Citreicella sp. C3M06]